MENQVTIYPTIKVYNQGGYIAINNLKYPLNQPIILQNGPHILEITLVWRYNTFAPYIAKSRSTKNDGSKERLTRTNKYTEYTYHKEVMLEPGVYHLELDIRGESQLWLKALMERNEKAQRYGLPIAKGILIGSFVLMLIILGVLFLNYVYLMQTYPYFFLSAGVITSIFGVFMFIMFIFYLSIRRASRLKKEDLIPLNINIGTRMYGVVFWFDMRQEEVHVNK